ncbi:C4-dicarboxylate transporter DcuC [Turicimonas muris]|uniref:C4-dicarboxylate ABC transporter n=2 Tax=Turicimonas muris TaxID=1796652 RepID=A0A227KHK8_9BURK|nr:C4-dicarboxylate transporter DcuC [Turicimonas muris]ANU66596.1 C4-dicarboxylate ABC transporter [Burkholderiales bacterium YL45]MBS4768591.1 C4-dicarboxylate transporter DcuC [Burkholderiales bacterium]OXE47242.1 C4-dicarboxylate ABC transporter [Turicimonas muris]QQQ97745.1 C4-dicarboxylate transporter DcuC [Turicimonas muris]
MSLNIGFALLTVLVTIYALIKRYETRFVLLAAGFAMAIFSLKPMIAFQQFDASMTKSSLIIAICSAMGFAATISLTKCDVHLVALLTRPLRKLGVFLLPACMVVTSFCAVAIPSTAGLCAAVGPSLIPILIRAGFKPAIAAAAIVCSTTPALFNPGVAHNVFVAKLADMEVMAFITKFFMPLAGFSIAIIVGLTVICFLYRDYKKPVNTGTKVVQEKEVSNLPAKVNLFYAIAPLVPVAILLYVSLYTTMKMSVATAMLIGTAYALVITRSNPAEVTKKFFDGMGKGYGNILGIIIAAGVFAAGLKAAGVVDMLVEALTSANHLARIGGAFGPYLMGVLTGSGDAAAFAFNEAVTPNAAKFGLQIADLGWLAVICGSFGRLSSPLAGGVILVAGMAGVNPMEIVKRSAPVMLCVLFAAYFLL